MNELTATLRPALRWFQRQAAMADEQATVVPESVQDAWAQLCRIRDYAELYLHEHVN